VKKVKILFLIVCLLLLSGCTFEYNINVGKDVISEDNIVFIENTNSNNIEDVFEDMVSKYTGPTNGLGMYKSSVFERQDVSGISYKRDYLLNDYNYSLSFSSCYDSYKLIKEDNKIIIATSDVFKCFDKYKELDNVIVNLTTDYIVEESNADYVDGNKHTWNINKENSDNKNISVVIDLSAIKSKKSIFSNSVFWLVLGAIILIGIIILFIMRRNKKINKI